ncbi:Two-component response regulator, YesN/AraC family, consists of REC and AraC-type DNA-binding domains [Cohnella sp. OV330]|uniref:helix-turn-helix domain-containing protein n=1 Tax=Cohnella sp. OV330 TaxID=1855288 RepID=UPI0008E3D0D4|nr:helix-turn-helix domain-containing protein [Cohnella sp. OV330]SFA77135.1 Two-component response regulator, YesN/AraC family, consists of REC and AraC-type DNA-binding domains [Cohnella sp. OV330]
MLLRRKSIFLTLWLSYILILLIPVTVTFVLYTNMEKTLIDNANRANLAMLEQARQVVDSNLQEMEQLGVQIAMQPKLQTLWTVRDGEKYIQYEEAVRSLRNIRNGSRFIDDLYIYLRDDDTVISSRLKTDATTFFTELYPLPGRSLDQVRSEILTGYHYLDFWPAPQAEQNHAANVIASAFSLPLGEGSNGKGTLIMLIDEQQIFDLLKQIQWVNKGTMLILDSKGQVIVSTAGRHELPAGLSAEISGTNGYETYPMDGQTQMLSYTTGQSGWKYISLVPKNVVLERVNEIKAWALGLLAFVVAAGSAAAYWMANRSYSPIRDLVYTINKGRSVPRSGSANEYEFIRTSITESFAESMDLKSKLAGHLPVVRAHFLSRLLKGQTDPAELTPDSLAFMGLHFPHPCVGVVLIEVDESKEFRVEESERDHALVRFIILNLSSELLRDSGYATETDGNRLALVLNVPDPSAETLLNRDRFIAELKEIVEGRFRMKITVATSSIHHGLPEVSRCYNEALNALDYRIIHGISSIIHYDQIREMERTDYYYPTEVEARFMNVLKSGELEAAERILDELYERNIGSRETTPELGKLLFMNILGTLLKVTNALKIDEKLSLDTDNDPVKQILNSASADEMVRKIKKWIEFICNRVSEVRSEQHERWQERMKQYIDLHYADPSLSLTNVADHFGLNPAYMSALFKKQYGFNLTDYMIELRISEAKRLLADPGMTVLQIAQRVGYSTDIGFIRTFKKIEGITPGKYREMLQLSGDPKEG